jgi:hypothetical protein
MSDVLERGAIYFVYRPRVNETAVAGLRDVQRFLFILHPDSQHRYRRVIVGRKRLPRVVRGRHQRFWAFVDRVRETPLEIERDLEAYRYRTRSGEERFQPAARPAGEGVYAIVRHGEHTHLTHALSLPSRPGDVQQTLGIAEQGNLVLTVLDPAFDARPADALTARSAAEDPDPPCVGDADPGRRFLPADPPHMLDREGCNLILIAAGIAPEESLDAHLVPDEQPPERAAIFRDLAMSPEEHPMEPLVTGQWR